MIYGHTHIHTRTHTSTSGTGLVLLIMCSCEVVFVFLVSWNRKQLRHKNRCQFMGAKKSERSNQYGGKCMAWHAMGLNRFPKLCRKMIIFGVFNDQLISNYWCLHFPFETFISFADRNIPFISLYVSITELVCGTTIPNFVFISTHTLILLIDWRREKYAVCGLAWLVKSR